MARIEDVALRAGVSIKTVSRVANGEPYVHEATQARVRAAMRELGYVGNVSARRLASGRAHALGFIFHNPSWQYVHTALQGVMATARAHGYDTVLHPCDAEDPSDCRRILDLVARRSVDGLVFTPPCDIATEVVTELTMLGVPFVRITPRDRSGRLPYVTADDRTGAREMVRYLIGLGHHRIGFISGSPVQIATEERLAGYRDALTAAGIAHDPGLLRRGDFSYESGRAAAEALFAQQPRPTAIFASNDDMAAGVLAAAHNQGVPVPRVLSVAGFDNVPLSWQIWPPLTTVAQPISDLAVTATDLLVRWLAGEDVSRVHSVKPTWLVLRESTSAAERARR